MSRYVDADRFIEWLDVGHLRTPCEKCHSDYDVKEMIDSQQTADVQEVRHGRWDIFNNKIAQCSVCRYGRAIATQFWWNFCPACGAKMEEEEQK